VRLVELEGGDGKIFVIFLGQEGGPRVVGNSRCFRDKREAGHMCAAEASVSAVVNGRGLGQLEGVFPGRRGRSGRSHDLVASVVARGWVSGDGLVVPRALVLAATADRPSP